MCSFCKARENPSIAIANLHVLHILNIFAVLPFVKPIVHKHFIMFSFPYLWFKFFKSSMNFFRYKKKIQKSWWINKNRQKLNTSFSSASDFTFNQTYYQKWIDQSFMWKCVTNRLILSIHWNISFLRFRISYLFFRICGFLHTGSGSVIEPAWGFQSSPAKSNQKYRLCNQIKACFHLINIKVNR